MRQRYCSLPGDRLLQHHAVTVRIVDLHVAAPGSGLDAVGRRYAPLFEVRHHGVEVVDAQQEALGAPRRHGREPGHERDRGLSLRGGQAEPPHRLPHRLILLDTQAEDVGVEVLGPVGIAHRHRDDRQAAYCHSDLPRRTRVSHGRARREPNVTAVQLAQPFDRRQLFRRAGALAAVAGPAIVLGACGGGEPPPVTVPTTIGGPPNWGALASSLQGNVALPTDATFATDKPLFDTRFDGLNPAAIAFCRSPTDVQRCVDFARGSGVQLAARSGGHSYAGYSTCPGLIVDVTGMADVTVANGTTAVIGAGARLIDIYGTLGPAGVLLPGGSCPTVGIAGLTLGGGIGG